MEKYSVYEELITEYTLVDEKPRLLFEVEAESFDEAYRLFLQRHPHKVRTPVAVKVGNTRYINHSHDASVRVYGLD